MWKKRGFTLTLYEKDYWISAKLSAYITDLENT